MLEKLSLYVNTAEEQIILITNVLRKAQMTQEEKMATITKLFSLPLQVWEESPLILNSSVTVDVLLI